MKNVFALAFLLLSFVSFSQSVAIRGSIKDATNNEPIIAASIGVAQSGLGTISNEEGIFQLTAPKSANIIITCLGYKTATIPASEFTEATKTVLLVQSEEVLEEVMVTKIPLSQVMEDIIAASKSRFNKPIVLHTYYREFVKIDDKYKKFSDALIDYHASGGSKKTNADLIVKQNRSFSLVSSDEDEDESLSPSVNVQRGIFNSYNFEFLEKNILKEKRLENYELTLKSRKVDGRELYAIVIEPKREIEKSLFEGVVIYDPETKLIYEFDLHYAASHMQYIRTMSLLGLHVNNLDSKVKAVYKMVNNNYVLAYNNRYGKYKVWTKKYSELMESRSDLIVTDFEKDDLKYNKKEVYKKKYLYDKPTNFSGKFWQKNNAIVLTAEEEKVIASLEKEAASMPKTE